MAKHILIDLSKFRDIPGSPSDHPRPEGYLRGPLSNDGLRSIRELAVFHIACRRCKLAPCAEACPADALERNEEGVMTRSVNLCVSCKSCVVICPFGTLMGDFFDYHPNRDALFNLDDERELEQFIKASPEGAVQRGEFREIPEENIYSLSDRIFVRDRSWILPTR